MRLGWCPVRPEQCGGSVLCASSSAKPAAAGAAGAAAAAAAAAKVRVGPASETEACGSLGFAGPGASAGAPFSQALAAAADGGGSSYCSSNGGGGGNTKLGPPHIVALLCSGRVEVVVLQQGPMGRG